MGKIGIDSGMVLGMYFPFSIPVMKEFPESYLIKLICHQSLIYSIEKDLSCYFLICLDTQSLILIDLETRLSISIVKMTDDPRQDLLKLAKKWSEALTSRKSGDKNEH